MMSNLPCDMSILLHKFLQAFCLSLTASCSLSLSIGLERLVLRRQNKKWVNPRAPTPHPIPARLPSGPRGKGKSLLDIPCAPAPGGLCVGNTLMTAILRPLRVGHPRTAPEVPRIVSTYRYPCYAGCREYRMAVLCHFNRWWAGGRWWGGRQSHLCQTSLFRPIMRISTMEGCSGKLGGGCAPPPPSPPSPAPNLVVSDPSKTGGKGFSRGIEE